jgi:hypothetical protein
MTAKRAEGSNQYGDRRTEVLRHQQHLDDFITWVGLDRTEETCRLYEARIRLLIRAWDAIDPTDWTNTRLEKYVGDGKAGRLDGQLHRWSARSVQMHLQSAKLFGDWCRKHGVPCPEFWTTIKKPRVVTDEDSDFYTIEEATALLEAAEATDHPYYFRIALGFGMGMRRSEQTRAR